MSASHTIGRLEYPICWASYRLSKLSILRNEVLHFSLDIIFSSSKDSFA